MHVGTLKVTLHIPESRSLKDKRQVVKSILDRMRNTFQVSAAEVDDQDILQIAVLGFSYASGSHHHAQEVMSKILDALMVHPVARVTTHEIEVL